MTSLKLPDSLSDIFSTFSSRIIAVIFALILSILIARVLGPAVKGYLSVISLIGSVCLLLGALGINSFNIYLAAKDKNKIKNLFANSFWFSLVMSLICVGLIFIFYQFFPLIFRNIPPKHLFIYLFSLPFLFFFTIITPILAGEQKFKLYNFFLIFYPFLNLVFIVFLLFSHFQSLKFLVAAYSLTNIIIGLLVLILVKPHEQKNLQFDFELFKQSLGYGLKIYLVGIFAVLVLKVDLYMVNFFKGATEAGLYSLVSSFGDVFFLLPYSIAFVILPKITSQEDTDKGHSIANYFRFTFYLSLILAVGVALFIKPTIQLLYGPTFLPSAETIIIILPGLICWALVAILGQYFAATSFNVKIIIGWLLAFLLNIVLNYLYIPQYGMKAAAVTSDLSYFFILIYIFILFKKETKIPLKALLKPLPYSFIKSIINIKSFFKKT